MFVNARMRLSLSTILVLLTTGCVSYQNVTESTSVRADNAFLSRITIGETSSHWLARELGEPQKIITNSAASTIWQYHHVVNHATRFRALPIIAVELEKAQLTVVNFEISNDIITRTWQGSAAL